MAFPSGFPCVGESSKPASGGAVTLQPEARGDTRVTEHVDFSRESSWPAVRVSREVGLNKGLWVQRCVGAVLWGRAAVTKHHQQGGAGELKSNTVPFSQFRGQISETMKTLRQRLFRPLSFWCSRDPPSSSALGSITQSPPASWHGLLPRVSESFLPRTPFRATYPIDMHTWC